MIKKVLKVCCFTALLSGILFLLTRLFTPTWKTWNNDNTMQGFYKEPKNSFQVLFLGTSQVASGISPIELYNRYGICAYNLGTERQPILASYYWLQETERLHPDTLKVVVLDVSYVFFKEKKYDNLKFMSEKALAHMHLSPVKLAALKDLSEKYDDFDYIENLIPLLRYHSRWNMLGKDDFKAVTCKENIFFTRGQEVSYKQCTNYEPSKILVPRWDLTDEYEALEEDPSAYTNAISLDNYLYVTKIYNFCKDHSIKLVFTKIPKGWSDFKHDASNYLASTFNVPFIDYSQADILDDMSLYYPFDYKDVSHPNVRGAQKISNYIGRYLKTHFSLDDVRTIPYYDYLKTQSEQYKIVKDDSYLTPITSLSSYLSKIDQDRYTVFVTVAGDATMGMSDSVKKQMSDLGFRDFPSLSYGHAYAAVRTNGKVIQETISTSKKGKIIISGVNGSDGFVVSHVYNETLDKDGFVLGTEEGTDPVVPSGMGYFSMVSESNSAGGNSSVYLNNDEQSDNRHGLNFLVYDNVTRLIIDSASFDLRYINERRSDLDPIEKYNLRIEKLRAAAEEARLEKEAGIAE